MADEEFYDDDGAVEISGDEDSSKISELNAKISDLERENSAIIRENKEFKQRIEELKGSVEELSGENVELKRQVEKAQSENRALTVVAARAAELQAEVSRLQCDLVAATSGLQEANVELSELKRDLEGVKGREKENDVKLEAAEREKALLVAEVERLVGEGRGLRVELEGKEKEVEALKSNVGDSKSFEALKSELEKKIESMKVEMRSLESSLDEKEKVISEFETRGSAVLGGVDGDGVVEGGKRGLVGGLKRRDWLVVGGSTVAAVAVIGVVCYIHAARKH